MRPSTSIVMTPTTKASGAISCEVALRTLPILWSLAKIKRDLECPRPERCC